ncbi:MAG: DnaJ (Hsp40), subfamily C, member 8, variant 2 [Marteilia pararefringens]
MADSEQLQTTNEGEEVDDEILNNFFTQIKEKKVEKKIVNTRPELPCKYEDKNHLIDHLCRPAAKYGNLNPFDVLDLDFECQESDVMTRYRKLAKMCHPDRNFDRADDASKAYQAITKAKDFLLAEGNKGLCISIVEQAKDFVTNSMENKRLLLRKQGLKTKLLEDDRNQYFEAVKKRVSVIFADMELMKEVACKKERDRM